MAKTILGIDIGYDSLKLAVVNGKQVRRTAVGPMPQNLIREGRVVSTETMGELIRRTMKEHGIRSGRAALVLPNETVFIRSVTMPLMAVAAPKSLLEESKETMHRAGLKLVKAAPSVCAFQNLIRATTPKGEENTQEYCILDLGYQAIRMYMFRGDRHMVTRVLEIGMSSLDQVISEAYSVDIHLAHTYLLSNYEDCQSKEYCMNAYGTITVELMRALNFYRFSNPDSHLEDIWVCGGGACIKPLQESIAETLDLRIHTASELMPGGAAVEEDYALLQAIGIALE